MLWTLVVILVVLWLLGFFAFHITAFFIHVLLVIAVVMILLRVISGRKPI